MSCLIFDSNVKTESGNSMEERVSSLQDFLGLVWKTQALFLGGETPAALANKCVRFQSLLNLYW